MKLLRLRKLHRWVALVVGAQVLVWTASGLAFAWLDHHGITGEALAAAPLPRSLPLDAVVLDPARLPIATQTPIVDALELRELDGTWVYRLQAADGTVSLLRASDGAPFAIDAATTRRLAASHYRGSGRLQQVRAQPAETLETRGFGATWQATYDDDAGTRLYFSAADGPLVAVRSAIYWRAPTGGLWSRRVADASGGRASPREWFDRSVRRRPLVPAGLRGPSRATGGREHTDQPARDGGKDGGE